MPVHDIFSIYPFILICLHCCPGWLWSSCCFGNPGQLYGLARVRRRRSKGGGEAWRKVIKREFTSVQRCWVFSWDTKPLWENESALKWVSGIEGEKAVRETKRSGGKRESGIQKWQIWLAHAVNGHSDGFLSLSRRATAHIKSLTQWKTVGGLTVHKLSSSDSVNIHFLSLPLQAW